MKTTLSALLFLFATALTAAEDLDLNQLLDEQIAAERAEREALKDEHDSAAQRRADDAWSNQWIRFMELLKASNDDVLKAEFLKADYLHYIADRQFLAEHPESPEEFQETIQELAAYQRKLARIEAWLEAHPRPDAGE